MSQFNLRRTCRLDEKTAAGIKYLLGLGLYQHDIAAFFRINQGRVSEVGTGKRFKNVLPSKPEGWTS